MSNNLIRIGNGNTFTRMTGSYYTPSPYNSDFFITNNIASFTSNSTDILSLTTDYPGGATAIRLIAPYNSAGAIALCVGTNGGVPSNVMMVTPTGVGIAKSTPQYLLDVGGTINTTSQFVANVDATNTNPLSLANNAASGSLFQILQTGTPGGWLNNCVAGDTSLRSFGKLLLAAGSTSGTGILNASIILGNSNYCVGIGSNVNPSYNLDVVGTTRHTTASSLAANAPDGGANHGLMLVSTKAPDSGKTAYSMALGVDSGTGYAYINAAGNTTLQPILLQSRGGGVGINLTTAPQAALDVNGTIRGTIVGNVTTSTQATFQADPSGAIWYYSTDGQPRLRFESNGTSTLAAATKIIFQTPANTAMTNISSTGMRVGDGTTASYMLDVNGAINAAGNIYTRYGTGLFAYGEGDYYGVNTFVKTGSDGNGLLQVSYAGNATHGYLYLGAQGGAAHICISSNAMSINTGAAPAYTLDVGGNANFGPAAGGALYVGTSNGLFVYGASNGHGYIRADLSTASSDKILYLGTGQSNIAEISRSNVVFYPSNAVYVKSNAGSGNFVVEGTSYLKDISNTNVYSTGAFFSGTTAGRLAMVGVQNACYIEAALNSDTGSAAPLYFTDMNNANQWMCIGSTGNVGINNNSPVGRFHVRTSGNALDTFLGWDSTWMVVTPSANATTAKNTPGLGLGYSVASNTGYVTALAPNDTWKDLRLDGSNIRLVPHDGGDVKVSGTLRSDNFITAGTATVGGIKASGTSLTTTVVNGDGTGSNVIYVGSWGGSTLNFGVNLGTFMCAFSLRSTSGYYTGVAYFDPRGPTFQAMNPGYAATFTQSSSGQNLNFSNLSGSVSYHFRCYCVSST
uniref:Tail protein n=1 Tax=viral metagenome TaxID=1070528 RepID=A0A6C0EP10_9ZZZZ